MVWFILSTCKNALYITAFKPKTPYGNIPVLDIDGKLLAGNGPIVRYIAEEYGLAGSSAFENTEIPSLYNLNSTFKNV